MKPADQLLTTLDRIRRRRERLKGLFAQFIEGAKVAEEQQFQIKGISILVADDGEAFDVSFNARRFRVMFSDNPQAGRGVVAAYKVDPKGECVLPTYFQFTFDGEGATDIPIEKGEDLYLMSNGRDPVNIVLNILDKGMLPND